MDVFEELNTFRVLAREGTITGAANALGVAPSAVSRRLKALEDRLGTQLVGRDTRRLVLTAYGQRYLRGAERVLADLDALEESVREASGTISGAIRVTAPLSFGVSALPDVLSAFMTQHPAVEIDLDLSDTAQDLVGGGFDLALRIGTLASSSLVARKLCEVPFALTASPDFAEARGPFRTPSELEGLPILAYSGAPRGEVVSWRDGTEEGQVRLRPVLQANNGDLLTALAERGLGIAFGPRFIAKAGIDAGRLTEILPGTDWPGAALYAVRPPSDHVPARLRALIDHLAEALGR
ncbi:LysR family transcriptional regulator [Parvularcula dongshanensis]|uniref:DNA-binding transcriptional LysR family regulator n=1 Tax=Parvularcula dongshanensis TaxID=1173995 RepID=A0A840I1T5_9PROT|nr:LysR family transcriptional regulator [Parvularcula dongshanensis]MBB4658212.1 DNA-binding transcriptional LysR family regulator [Parvularcula dongshanensis]